MSSRRKKYARQEVEIEAQQERPYGYVNDSKARILVKTNRTIKIKHGKRKGEKVKVVKYGVKGSAPIKVMTIPVSRKDGADVEKYKAFEAYRRQLNLGYVKKRKFGIFTQNPRQSGRTMSPVSNELTTDEYFNDVYYNNEKPKIK
jgi:hypothetical protein